jgi:hypothetical protein
MSQQQAPALAKEGFRPTHVTRDDIGLVLLEGTNQVLRHPQQVPDVADDI